jgi:hypothetical protein
VVDEARHATPLLGTQHVPAHRRARCRTSEGDTRPIKAKHSGAQCSTSPAVHLLLLPAAVRCLRLDLYEHQVLSQTYGYLVQVLVESM